MNIIGVTIIKTNGADKVFLKTDLPGAVYPFEEPLKLYFEVAMGGGEDYVLKHFVLDERALKFNIQYTC